MDTDTSAMLAKYRSRLSEYRQFVEEQEERVASAETSMEHAPARTPRRHVDPAQESGVPSQVSPIPLAGHAVEQSSASTNLSVGGAAAGGGRSPAARRPHDSHQPVAAAPPSARSRVDKTLRHPHGEAASTNGAGAVARGAASAAASTPRARPSQQQPAGLSPRRAAMTSARPIPSSSCLPPTHAAKADEEAAYVDQLFERRGRYRTTAPPDAMFVKTQLWAQRSRRNAAALRREQEAEALAECTFAPQIELSPLRRHGASRSASNSHSRVNSPGRVDEAVAQHLARLQAARKLKREKEARMSRSPAARRSSVHELTVPHGPNLGAPVAEPIPSLRKPFLPSQSRGSGTTASPSRAAQSNQRAAQQASPATSSAKNGVIRRWVEEKEGDSSAVLSPSGARGIGGGHVRDAEEEGRSGNRDIPVPTGVNAPPDADALRRQLSDKDAIIRGQRERIIALEKELADVKALVRQLQDSVTNSAVKGREESEEIAVDATLESER